MRCVRFKDLRTGHLGIGYIDGGVVRRVQGTLETFWQITDETFAMDEIQLLAPCVPKQIICVSFNYKKHADEFGVSVPREPSIFAKAAHTVIGTEENIIWPKQVKELAYGAELGIVVKKMMKNVAPENVHKYILGYTCANDVTASDLQRQERQWLRCKSFDTFCPLGPWLETELDPTDLSIKLWHNGVLKQDARTSDMVYSPYEILSYISHSFTLDAGDLILTGTPMGSGLMGEGDEVKIEIEGIGSITNRVIKEA
ncbi:MAG: fumarylacetoacetate hydrolase family protein [Phascolarctobacterium sp.]|uniref:fumarylacetoacetate hydrolase family protein n=1 Tax=Phascolarctobacterium sp. TaxID=2049039 RepID=UPI0026DD42EA|nr:fumarylacetoacetate hydrolase family protein [Phascolarctobacterium sp.]MDO4921824.1 fumarylacetoacetate hydrolase family protein [Phascolarctobacterium sp.]